MLRARPRLPAGPRTPKRTTSVQRRSELDDASNEGQSSSFRQHFSDQSSTSSLPFSSIVSQLPTADPQREPPAASLVTNESSPPNPDASQVIHSPSRTDLPLEDRHLSTQPIPSQVPDTSRPSTPTPLLTPASFETSPALRKPSHATISSAIAPLTLPATQMDFTPDPLPYQHLTLDAAHWTLTSTELQHLVSSAIRQSAKEQLIRLLPPPIIDTRMPEDAARIESTWDTAATRWRFEANRRNMLLRALSASGADNDLLSQLSVTLSNIDLHAQNLLHAAAHRAQLAAARDTHRASALAVALRKLNASYARRTRDLDKARAHIAALRGEVDEAWKVAEEQAVKVDKFKVVAMAVATEPSNADPEDSVVDDENLYEDDTSSNALQDISCAEVIDVTGKAIAAQARLTMMRAEHSSPRLPPSSYSTRFPSSPATSGSNNSQRQSTVSRASTSRKRSRRKSKASLRLSIPNSARSRSSIRGKSGVRNARSKSRNKKGKEPARAEPLVPWINVNAEGSFLEMGGRPVGDEAGEQVGGSGEDHHDVDGSVGEEPQPDSLETAEPSPHSPLSNSTSIPESQIPPPPKTIVSQPPVSPLPLGDDISLAAVVPSTRASAPELISRRSSSSSPLTSPVPSASSTPLIPSDLESHQQPQSPLSQSSDILVEEKVEQGKDDLIPDPASIFPVSTSSKPTATTAASAPDLSRRGYSLESRSLSTSTNGGSTKSQNGGSKIRRSISEFLHFSTGSRIRRQSVPLPLKSRSVATSLGPEAGVMRQDLREESQGEDGLENGWEDVRSDEA